jgi:hypothetical protein
MDLEGSCSCGAIKVRLSTTKSPAELPVRQCGCTFCVARKPRYTSDPSGHVAIEIDESQVDRHRFGLRLADFLVCKRCDLFVAAIDDHGRAVINSSALARAAEFTAEPLKLTIYDTEDVVARETRRAANWTPATLVVR